MADAKPQIPWWVLPSLAAYGMTVFAGLAIASCFIGNATLQTTMFTAAISLGGAGFLYFFQSSAGSASKDAQTAEQTTKTIDALASSAPASGPAPSPAATALDAKLPASV